MLIREATLADIPRCVAMGEAFLDELYPDLIHATTESLTQVCTDMIAQPHTVVFVSEQEGQVTGMIGLVVVPHFLSGERVAVELFWWMDHDVRGQGLKLLACGETWARAQGAIRLQVTAPALTDIGILYGRLGFRPVETAYVRDVGTSIRVSRRTA